MSSYRITNRMPTSIVLEDVGITLQRAGGSDSSAVIPESLYLGSRDVRDRKDWLRVEKIHEPSVAPPPVNTPPPKLAQNPPPKLATDTSPAPSVPAFPMQMGPSASEVAALHETIRIMGNNMAKLVGLIAQQQSERHVPSYPQHDGSPTEHRVSRQERPVEPVYIPGTILPKDAETHISTQDKDSSDEGFDESAAALRNLRKKTK